MKNFYSYFLLFLLITNPLYSMYRQAVLQLPEIENDSVINLHGAVDFSWDVPHFKKINPLADTLCTHMIECAPASLQAKVQLLMNIQTREECLPDLMILHGQTGTGKSLLAHAIAQKLGIPFMIAKSAFLFNKHANSVATGLRIISKIAAEKKATIIIDDVDCVANKHTDLKTLTAFVKLLDNVNINKTLFIGTTNELSRMPKCILERFQDETSENQDDLDEESSSDSKTGSEHTQNNEANSWSRYFWSMLTKQ